MRDMDGKIGTQQRCHCRQANEKSLCLKRGQAQRGRGAQCRAKRHTLFSLIELPIHLKGSAGQRIADGGEILDIATHLSAGAMEVRGDLIDG